MLGPDEFAGTINVGIAAVKGSYAGKIKLEDKRPPEHYKMLVDGKGKRASSKAQARWTLIAKGPNETIVKYAGDVQVGGPLQQVGQRSSRAPPK